MALLVSERTLLPVFMPLAPARTLPARVPAHIAAALRQHGVPDPVIDDEPRQMAEQRVDKTASRSIVGVAVEIAQLAGYHREPDLVHLSVRLARTPLSPLSKRNISPDRELSTLMQDIDKNS